MPFGWAISNSLVICEKQVWDFLKSRYTRRKPRPLGRGSSLPDKRVVLDAGHLIPVDLEPPCPRVQAGIVLFYQVDGKWSDLRLKLVDSNNCVLAQDDGPWIFENGERHVWYDHRLQEGDTYWIVVEKISLVGDTWFGGTVKLQT